MKKNKKSGMSGSKKVAIGAGVAAAVGAGAYYLMGPNGKKNQQKVKVLADKIKKEVVSDSKKIKGEWDKASKIVKKTVQTLKKKSI